MTPPGRSCGTRAQPRLDVRGEEVAASDDDHVLLRAGDIEPLCDHRAQIPCPQPGALILSIGQPRAEQLDAQLRLVMISARHAA